jgi:hypothetical protein
MILVIVVDPMLSAFQVRTAGECPRLANWPRARISEIKIFKLSSGWCFRYTERYKILEAATNLFYPILVVKDSEGTGRVLHNSAGGKNQYSAERRHC